jgi:hypothetical protein
MSTTHTNPLAMSLSPVGFKVPASDTAQTYTGHVTVTDTGTAAITVKPSAITLGKHTGSCTQGPPSWLKIETANFHLNPGQSHVVAFEVQDTPGLSGNGAVMAYGSVPGHGVHASAGVGAQVKLGDGRQVCTRPVSLPAPSSGGAPLALIVGLPLLLVALLAVVAVVVKRRRAA